MPKKPLPVFFSPKHRSEDEHGCSLLCSCCLCPLGNRQRNAKKMFCPEGKAKQPTPEQKDLFQVLTTSLLLFSAFIYKLLLPLKQLQNTSVPLRHRNYSLIDSSTESCSLPEHPTNSLNILPSLTFCRAWSKRQQCK